MTQVSCWVNDLIRLTPSECCCQFLFALQLHAPDMPRVIGLQDINGGVNIHNHLVYPFL